ncbi:Transposase IS4 [Popillia japonica]|uniref:Transposase IS4 n=1 Tax=Popillia japonica TaxID=7064 RepID=A0AAW1KPS9_POPJA
MEQNEIEEEQISEAIQEVPDTWLPVTGVSLKKFETVEIGSINIASGLSAIDIYKQIIDEHIMRIMVDETNKNAHTGLSAIDIYKQIIDEHIMRIMVDETNKNAHKYRANWKNVNIAEMEKFLAIVMYMGLVKYPKRKT